MIAYCESEEEFNTQMDALHADLITYNQLYDIYNDYPGVTNVKTINDNAGSAPVEVDDRILSMLELADQMYQTTNGKLNVEARGFAQHDRLAHCLFIRSEDYYCNENWRLYCPWCDLTLAGARFLLDAQTEEERQLHWMQWLCREKLQKM